MLLVFFSIKGVEQSLNSLFYAFVVFCSFRSWSQFDQVDTEQDRVILIRTVVQFMATKVRQFLIFFLATILNLSWCRHTSSWTQRSFISQMATLWKSCSRYKRILLTPYRQKVIRKNAGYVGPLLRYEKQQRQRGRQRSKSNWSCLFWEQYKRQDVLLSFSICSNITFSIIRAGYDHWSIFSGLWGILRLANLRYWVQAGRVEAD